jgi:hypothetical protein
MGLIYAGIDEAGYGPMFGPLCVGMTAFRVSGWSPGEPAPDLWSRLSRAVSRSPDRRGRRVAVADSKAIKLPNGCKSRHPLVHLERGVLSFLSCVGVVPGSDSELFERLGTGLDDRPWYGGEPVPLPVAQHASEIGVAGAALAGIMELAGVELLALRCAVVCESAFNETFRRTRSKAEATAAALGSHFRALTAMSEGEQHARVVCDRLGGRTAYAGLLTREVPGAKIVTLEESAECSRYELRGRWGSLVVRFMPEAESGHLPVALASMAAKYARELAMGRFNRYWCGRCPELKPTAGYVQDARRWLAEAVLEPGERAALVRLA